jgi:hypothetical protein
MDAARVGPLGRVPDELLDMPDCPAGFEYLWQWFIALHNKRQSGFGGVCRLAESEIESYFRNRKIIPHPWEVEMIDRLDEIAIEVKMEDQSTQED